ncbi:MAG: hypothetical protein HFH64_00565 [Lachnospiraceae bacterium]|nr:hypothetical protein [Lachnospiraceae bacterium]
MKKLSGLIFLIVIMIAASNGWIEPIINFFSNIFIWLFTLSMTQSSVSIVGEIFVKVATFAISYSVVGALFRAIGWFDSDIMKIAYFVISTIVSFVLCYIVMIFETHLLLIAIIAGVLLIAGIAVCILLSRLAKRETI